MKTTDVRVRRAITAMAGGHAVVLTGDPNGDGYLVFAAQAATPRLVAFAVRHTSGYLRVALPGAECERLHLPPMCDRDTTHCVSVDVRGTGTGISASDRAWTIAALASATSVAADFQRPGHVVPVQAQADGVLGRRGPAEAAAGPGPPGGPGGGGGPRRGGAVALPRGGDGRRPAALCEIVSPDNPVQMAHHAESVEFAVEHGLAMVSIGELVAYRRRIEPQVVRFTAATLPTWAGASRVIGFRDVYDLGEHLAVIVGAVGAGVPVPLHVHIECLTGDVFGSTACRCGEELNGALARMSAQGSGVVLYLRPPGPAQACGLFARGDAATDVMPETVTWILRDLGVYAIRLSDDVPGFGLVMFGAIREASTLAAAG
ncbi:3,4-dihydroxy-2-butanone-4-phosphate synthase [Mycobacterium tuberculosis]|uniref:3,4-dihydroxy-2-butanone-4-phosphate synthase n=1 Tax=Mycobacterium tuberculosis TaxID=1773 RepID=UPI00070CBA78|nr:3,4-dihydroxy-2-butanone-4-phosphate synthase [Mycobacterium tuberculosis]